MSSQYLTALLMAAPLATGDKGITIKIRDELVSQPYVDMTVRLMERCAWVMQGERGRDAEAEKGPDVVKWTGALSAK